MASTEDTDARLHAWIAAAPMTRDTRISLHRRAWRFALLDLRQVVGEGIADGLIEAIAAALDDHARILAQSEDDR